MATSPVFGHARGVSVLDRFSQVVKSEWSHRFGKKNGEAPAPARDGGGGPGRATAPHRPAVVDVDGALRVLELSGTPTLAEVRARYQELSRRYYPKTRSARDDEAHAARVVVGALTDALELLEEHLLPLA